MKQPERTWWRITLRDRTNGRKFHISVLAQTNDEATGMLSEMVVSIGDEKKPLYQAWSWLGTEPDYELREKAGNAR